jgi:hypothetical protein
MLENTATEEAPWFVVPADNKWFARFLVSQIVLDAMKKIDPQIPALPDSELAKLAECRRLLEEDE